VPDPFNFRRFAIGSAVAAGAAVAIWGAVQKAALMTDRPAPAELVPPSPRQTPAPPEPDYEFEVHRLHELAVELCDEARSFYIAERKLEGTLAGDQEARLKVVMQRNHSRILDRMDSYMSELRRLLDLDSARVELVMNNSTSSLLSNDFDGRAMRLARQHWRQLRATGTIDRQQVEHDFYERALQPD
jgi:hypothetical protein